MPPDQPIHFRIIQGGRSPTKSPEDSTRIEPVIVTGQATLIITSSTTLRMQFWTTTPTQALAIDLEMPDGVAVTQWLRQHGFALPVPPPPAK